MLIVYRTARENVAEAIRIQRNRQVFPIEKIFADSVTPMHRPPHSAVGIVLIEQMILSVEENHAVRIVHPHLRRGEMKDGTMLLRPFIRESIAVLAVGSCPASR